MKAKDLDKKLDSGEDITKSLDLSKARRPDQEQKRVNVDFPVIVQPLYGLNYYNPTVPKIPRMPFSHTLLEGARTVRTGRTYF